MPTTVNTSSSPVAEQRLIGVPLDQLHPHPANPNLMPDDRLDKLARNIDRQKRYPPLIVRPHPDLPGAYQVLDGHQRLAVLRRLDLPDAVCFLWPCDDQAALILLATLNRLEGEDVPAKRADLLRELTDLVSAQDLALLLPESAAEIQDLLAFMAFDPAGLLAELEAATQRQAAAGPRLISFAVSAQDEQAIERAIALATEPLEGSNKRGLALGVICRAYLEVARG